MKSEVQRAVYGTFFSQSEENSRLGEGIVHHQIIPARPALFDRLSFPLPGILTQALEQKGLHQLYSHQVEALEAIHPGQQPSWPPPRPAARP